MIRSIVKLLVLSSLVAIVSACSSPGPTPDPLLPGVDALFSPHQVQQTVAVQALGSGAFPISAAFGQKLRVPAIYKVGSDGMLLELCANDFRQQAALLAITVEESVSTDVIFDKLKANRGFFRLGGLELSTPYAKAKVDGYRTFVAVAPNSSLVEDYIVANLGPNCPAVLAANKPYLIVTAVANAERAYTVSRSYLGGVIDFNLGPFGGTAGVDNDEIVEGPRTKVTFGARGVLVGAEPVI